MAVEFDLAAVRMGFVVTPVFRHEHSFVKLVKENIGVLGRDEIVIEPDFFLGHPRINQMVAAVHEINKEGASDETAIDEPNSETVIGFAQ